MCLATHRIRSETAFRKFNRVMTPKIGFESSTDSTAPLLCIWPVTKKPKCVKNQDASRNGSLFTVDLRDIIMSANGPREDWWFWAMPGDAHLFRHQRGCNEDGKHSMFLKTHDFVPLRLIKKSAAQHLGHLPGAPNHVNSGAITQPALMHLASSLL